MADRLKVGVLGASGYTGVDLVRLLLNHPGVEISLLTADRQAGQPMAAVYPHLVGYGLPDLIKIDAADWSSVDVIFCGLPHGTTQPLVAKVMAEVGEKARIVDISADFRLRDPDTYQEWYGNPHSAVDLQSKAVYGLSEMNRDAIRNAHLVACPGCYPTALLLATLPLVRQRAVDLQQLVYDAKSGVSGAGRSLKQNLLFCESGEGLTPYAIGRHRHMPEIEQEIAGAAGLSPNDVRITFTPHLVPMSRGELITSYLRPVDGKPETLHDILTETYADEPFVTVLPYGAMPGTAQVRGSNRCLIGVAADRRPGQALVISAIDNLVKGSSGQAIQNMNIMMGFEETQALQQIALFP